MIMADAYDMPYCLLSMSERGGRRKSVGMKMMFSDSKATERFA